MRRRGWSTLGIEPAQELVEYSTDVLGLPNIICAAWPPELELDFRADVVCMFHVIEHLLDPLDALAKTNQVLADDGLLVLETPNIESLARILFGKRCTQYDAPRHICLFARRTLALCLEKAGFEIMWTVIYSPTVLEYTESLRYLVKDLGLRRYRDKNAAKEMEASGENVADFSPKPDRIQSFPSRKLALQLFHDLERTFFRTIDFGAQVVGKGCNILAIAKKRSS